MDLIRSFTSDVLSKSMDGHLARQKMITSNLANVETPGYHRRDVSFQGQLQQAVDRQRKQAGESMGMGSLSVQLPSGEMRATHPLHFGWEAQSGADAASVAITPTEDKDHQTRPDHNGVDVESEAVQLAKNASKFKALTVLQGRMNQQLRGVLTNTTG